MEAKNYTVSQYGEVTPASFEPEDDLKSSEILDAACRVLRLSGNKMHNYFAEALQNRFGSYIEDGQPLLRAGIANILGIIRMMLYYEDNRVDYTFLSLCQGNKESRIYLENLIPRWEKKKKKRGDLIKNNSW